MVRLAQLVRASDCGSEGRGFDPHISPFRDLLRGPFFIYPLFYFLSNFYPLKPIILKINILAQCLLAISVLAISYPAYAQRSMSTMSNQGSGSDTSQGDSKTSYKPGNAWTLSYPLGSHIPSSIDTLLYNYQRQFVPALSSDAWATTGQVGGEGLNMIYFKRPQGSQFMFEDALMHWIPTFNREKFYNVYVPMTLVSYNFGGGNQNSTDRLTVDFAGNANRRVGVGANFDLIYTKGNYNSMGLKNLMFGAEGYYTGNRYEMQAFFSHYHSVNQENGGITDDLYIQDPAQLQGGVSTIEAMSIPTRLNGAQNRTIGAEFYMSHAYKVGFWRDDTQPGDTIEKKTLVPVTKFIYAFDYKFNQHEFKNVKGNEAAKFWKNTYFNLDRTFDTTDYFSVANTIGVSMIEGFQTWANFGVSAYASYEYDRFKQGVLMPETAGDETNSATGSTESESSNLSPLPQDFNPRYIESRNRLWVGGRLEKLKGKLFRYSADAKLGLSGDAIGDLDLTGYLQTRFSAGSDTLTLTAGGFLRNQTPSYLMRHYVSNHYIWNNDFGKVRTARVEGEMFLPWIKCNLSAGVENVQNLIYFNSDFLPTQYSGNIQILSASLEQKLRFGIWNWNNRVTYQKTSDSSRLPLPELAVYSNMFLGFTAFNVLHTQLGVDCDYYTKYKGVNYQPATMSFAVQGENPVWVGNFPIMNLYFTAKLSKTRFFVMWSHFNQGLFGPNNYFSMPHYPIDPAQLRFGLSVDFAD